MILFGSQENGCEKKKTERRASFLSDFLMSFLKGRVKLGKRLLIVNSAYTDSLSGWDVVSS
jgi:hypothetical protein